MPPFTTKSVTDRKISESSLATAPSQPAEVAPSGVRRSGRIAKEIAILLIGSDTEGKVFSEETKTVLLSRHGAGIISTHKLAPEQELFLRCLDTDKETEVRVVGQLGSQSGCYTYGVAMVAPVDDFWGISFPPLSESDRAADRVWLECKVCRDRVALEHDDIDLDVYAINDGILRYCKQCICTTLWKRSSAPDEAVQAPPAPQPKPADPFAPAPPARRTNRRAHVRTKADFTACVRNPSFDEDDIVVCENISRGGLCFKSRKRYYETTLIEVAVPYEPGGPVIFVPARIVRVQELPGEKRFRCGVAYLHTSRDPRSL